MAKQQQRKPDETATQEAAEVAGLVATKRFTPDELNLLYPCGIPLDFRKRPTDAENRHEVLVDSVEAFEALEAFGFTADRKETLLAWVTDGEQRVRASIFKRNHEIVAKLHMATAEDLVPLSPGPTDEEVDEFRERQSALPKPPSVRWSDIRGDSPHAGDPEKPLLPGEPPPPGVERPLQ